MWLLITGTNTNIYYLVWSWLSGPTCTLQDGCSSQWSDIAGITVYIYDTFYLRYIFPCISHYMVMGNIFGPSGHMPWDLILNIHVITSPVAETGLGSPTSDIGLGKWFILGMPMGVRVKWVGNGYQWGCWVGFAGLWICISHKLVLGGVCILVWG